MSISKLFLTLALASLAAAPVAAQTSKPVWLPDQGDGTYRNPILAGDYSDPDVIRVGEAYYMTTSSFTNTPGLPILRSTDLVNWTVIGHALNVIPPTAHHATPRRGGGVWAPAIRHHDGKFMIYYPDPDFGIFLTTATDQAGPWTEPVLVDNSVGAIDPCPFWDDDGTGWLFTARARSRAGFANVMILQKLSADGSKTVTAPQTVVDGDKLPKVETFIGPSPWITTEGPKVYKRNGWYYLFAPSGSVKGGWQGVFRSRDLQGPYEGRNVLDQGATPVNGPHQGAWVTTPKGEDWFVHFQDADSYGRRVWLEPMVWKNDWPVIGEDRDGDGRGQPVLRWKKPTGPPKATPTAPPTDDAFDGTMNRSWQWNANAADDWSSLTARPGALRLKSISSPQNLWEAGALLTQKLPADRFTANTEISFAPKAIDERAGLVMFGANYAWIGLENTATGPRLVRVDRLEADRFKPETLVVGLESAPSRVFLRLTVEPTTVADPPPSFSPYAPAMLRSTHARVVFSYSLDGVTYQALGEPFVSRPGRWVGAQMGVFAQAPAGTPANTSTRIGWTDVERFWVTP